MYTSLLFFLPVVFLSLLLSDVLDLYFTDSAGVNAPLLVVLGSMLALVALLL